MDTIVRRFQSWFEICITTASPWSYCKGPRYTVVHRVDVVFSDDCDDLIRNMITTWMKTFHQETCDDNNHVILDMTRYDPWKKECGFEFDWESLKLMVVKTDVHHHHAYFLDNKNRTSRNALSLYCNKGDEENVESALLGCCVIGCEEVLTTTPIIPWLHCKS